MIEKGVLVQLTSDISPFTVQSTLDNPPKRGILALVEEQLNYRTNTDFSDSYWQKP